MSAIRSLQSRKAALKSGLVSYARKREPDLDFAELSDYISDGIEGAFAPLEARTTADAGKTDPWLARETGLWRASQI